MESLLDRILTVVDPTFFKTPAAWRAWLRKNHAKASELWVGFYKVASGKGGITHREALDQALCFGWIDGKAKSLGDESWMIRFVRRKPGSPWSRVNIKRVGELREQGLMHAAGIGTFEGRDKRKDTGYARDESNRGLSPALVNRFRAKKKAWKFWEAQPPGYKRTASYWVMSAKRDETRLRRLNALIEDSADGRRIGLLTPPGRR